MYILKQILFLFSFSVFCNTAFSKNISEVFLAKKIYERVTGMKVRAGDPVVQQMAELIKQNKTEEAALLATQQPQFINGYARYFSLGLSTKSGNLNVPFNDTALLMLGAIRDDLDFRTILTGEYRYELKSTLASQNPYARLINGATFDALDQQLPNYFTALDKKTNIELVKKYNRDLVIEAQSKTPMDLVGLGTAIDRRNHPNPAGIFSTFNFAKDQLSGGTNRRPVEYVVSAFLCSNMSEIGNSQASDAYVGRDIDRYPSGSHNVYLTNCKGCHTVMDGFRGAFAKTSFENTLYYVPGPAATTYGDASTLPMTQEKNAWFDEHYYETNLTTEVDTKKENSTLYKSLENSYGLNVYVQDAQKLKTADLANILAPTNTNLKKDAIAKAYSAYRAAEYGDVGTLSAINSIFEAYGLRADVLINPASGQTYESKNIKASWKDVLPELNYLVSYGRYLVTPLISELVALHSTEINQILSLGKTNAANVTKYGECVTQKTMRDFFICEGNLNKEASFFVKKVMSNLTLHGASENIKKFTLAHLTKVLGIGNLLDSFVRGERTILVNYLKSLKMTTYFNLATGHDLDTGVHSKMNKSITDIGYVTTSDTFRNLASATYGWRGPSASGGRGMKDFGQMIADSEAFSRCMVQKTIKSLCHVDASLSSGEVKKLANDFENSSYKMKNLVSKVITHKMCGVVND